MAFGRSFAEVCAEEQRSSGPAMQKLKRNARRVIHEAKDSITKHGAVYGSGRA